MNYETPETPGTLPPLICNTASDDSTFNNVHGAQFNNTVKVDLESVFRYIQDSVKVVQDLRQSNTERQKHAYLSVYRALSAHPALTAMRPPTADLGDLDWYSELTSSLPIFGGTFRLFGQNSHFKRASTLGEEGTRARIMMLLLWVIGHRLNVDKRRQLVSTAIGDGMAAFRPDDEHSSIFLQLHQIGIVVGQLAKMIGTRLPLAKESNPFYGSDFVAGDEDKPIPRRELWVYDDTPGKGLPLNMHYEFDIRRNPVILLRPRQGLVLVPQTKLSLLMIQWLTRNFGLGKKVFSPFDIDGTAFWNADPPGSCSDSCVEEEDKGVMISTGHKADDDEAMDMDMDELVDEYGGPEMIFNMLQDLPLEDWIHFRFCRSYQVHAWAHDRLARTLLFGSYCGSQRLPSDADISTSRRVAIYLRNTLVEDIIEVIELYILVESMKLWNELVGELEWSQPFQQMTKEERGLMTMFSDAAKETLDIASPVPPGPPAFQQAFSFLIDPTLDCPGEPDIVRITEADEFSLDGHADFNPAFRFPPFDSNRCICGRCASIHQQIVKDGMNSFQMIYLVWLGDESHRNGCDALEQAWTPAIEDAEQWVEDNVLGRLETPFEPFPSTDERRLGVAALHVFYVLGLEVGSIMDTPRFLRFVASLRYAHLYPDSFLGDKSVSADERDLLGFVSAPVGSSEDDLGRPPLLIEDDFDYEESKKLSLCSSGGWLYDLATSYSEDEENSSVVYILPESRLLSVHFLSSIRPTPQALHMPHMKPILPTTVPRSHMVLDAPESRDLQLPSWNAATADPQVIIDLSDDAIHGFPALDADANPHVEPHEDVTQRSSREGYTVQISARYQDRLFRTWWRPEVVVGQPCLHKDAYHLVMCCSMTSNQILLQVPPWKTCPPVPMDQGDYPPSGAVSFEPPEEQALPALKEFTEYHKYITTRLSERGGPLEQGRMCIVRCSEPGREQEEGPADPLIILAASLRLKVYILNLKECCLCACERMRARGYTVGIVMIPANSRLGNRIVSKCGHCVVADERTKRTIANYT